MGNSSPGILTDFGLHPSRRKAPTGRICNSLLLSSASFLFLNLQFKGQCGEILLQVFSLIIFPQAPDDLIIAILNFWKICEDNRNSRCTTGVYNTAKKWGKCTKKDFHDLFRHYLGAVYNL
jgi:hypothetical protein